MVRAGEWEVGVKCSPGVSGRNSIEVNGVAPTYVVQYLLVSVPGWPSHLLHTNPTGWHCNMTQLLGILAGIFQGIEGEGYSLDSGMPTCLPGCNL